ncbi:putative membrane protein [Wickerhamomyces ciferrii]|uniref:Membrane protein n=1 Tax=Wickerhamomyces ciferrii (strain ATCC 14091 / BCRC 22168 / CBS 111 / JCM 3599 / NBRC 0793 / NRRL Y-1031 F-60-10) TaxID=1206466 RepID=K0KGW1_WICCF|nr:uncharacterized protein BN7_963 [Wickerhamomyces ciferrii]CCH41422.1 putative membrane protein [Wickerhamomyces ciferrii]
MTENNQHASSKAKDGNHNGNNKQTNSIPIKATIRAILTTFYMILIILTVPISFQIGGIYCGLSFTVTLFNIYWILTSFSVFFKKNIVLSSIYYFQHLLIPSLLTLFLSIFNNSSDEILKNEHLIFYKFVLKPWKLFILNSTPLFTLLEGLCTILAIQSIGQTFRWLKSNKSESWVIISLLNSGGVITTSLYFLYRIYSSPIEIGIISASLIGAILTFCSGLGLYGIISNKGSTIESSLLFGYIVRCIYETFPELSNLASREIGFLISSATNQIKQEISNLPKIIIKNDSITQFFTILTLNVPNSFQTIIEFLIVTSKTITPSILINLAYRIAVFYSATRIIPALKNPAPSTKSMRLIYLFSPCIIIAVYTHLMMQYSNELDQEMCIWGWWVDYGIGSNSTGGIDEKIIVHPWQFWNWINMFTTLVVYAFELFGDQDEEHWKVD